MPPRYTIRQVVGTYRRKAFGTWNDDGTPRRAAYPAPAIVAFYAMLELAEEQPTRGHFESERLLGVLIEGPTGAGRAYAKRIPFLIAQGDLVRCEHGGLDVEGWRELQEGDVGIADRVRNFRARKKATETLGLTNGDTPHVTGRVTAGVTAHVTEEPRATAKATRRGLLGEGAGDGTNGSLLADSQEPPAQAEPPPDDWFETAVVGDPIEGTTGATR